MGLGSYSDFSLEEARHKASNYRKQVLEGIDPLEDKQKQADIHKKSHIKRVTFQHCINSYLDAHGDAWKNAKHREQWRSTLETYACPLIGNLNVAHINAGLVLKVWSRSGKPKQKPQPGYGGASKAFWIGQRSEVSGKGKILLDGKDISISCCHHRLRLPK